MKTSLKKIVAGASVATLVALNATFLTVNAAGNITSIGVNGIDNTDVAQNTEVTAITFTPTNLTDNNSIVISYPSDMQDSRVGNEFVGTDISISNGDGNLTDPSTATVDRLRNTITIPVGIVGTNNSPVTVDIANSHFATPDTKENILFTIETFDSSNVKVDGGSLEVYLNNANDVAVTARVAPILNMEIKATPYDITDVTGALH